VSAFLSHLLVPLPFHSKCRRSNNISSTRMEHAASQRRSQSKYQNPKRPDTRATATLNDVEIVVLRDC
jgi:hypothetical protein